MSQCYQEIASFQALPLHTLKISAHMVGQAGEKLSTLLTETYTHTQTHTDTYQGFSVSSLFTFLTSGFYH